MIPFLVIAVVMLAIACAWVLVPLLSRRPVATLDGDASNLSVLRDQRAELEADLANGVLSAEQYEAARMELDRRVLEDAAGDTDERSPCFACKRVDGRAGRRRPFPSLPCCCTWCSARLPRCSPASRRSPGVTRRSAHRRRRSRR